jgi:GT2 family glycosyltransferase
LNNFDLSIIIVSFNVKRLLEECLRSIYEYTKGISFEVIVIDNASQDGTALMIEEYFPHVKLLRSTDNLGFSKANNIGIGNSNGRHILFLNPDTYISDDCFTGLVQYLDGNPNCGAIGPKILLSDEKTIQYSCARKLNTPMSAIFRVTHLSRIWGDEYMSGWDHMDSREVECLSGSCMMVRRSVLDKINAFDENQFMYQDDTDLCFRIRKSDYKIFYCSTSKIVHLGGQSTKQINLKMRIEEEKAILYYFQKHYGSFWAFIYRLTVFFSFLARLLFRPLTLNFKDFKFFVKRDIMLVGWSLGLKE